jgi:hypothetical protein
VVSSRNKCGRATAARLSATTILATLSRGWYVPCRSVLPVAALPTRCRNVLPTADLFRIVQTSALKQALHHLFSQAKLPDNPHYFLAHYLSAYVDQSAIWREEDGTLLASYDLEGSIHVVDTSNKLCELSTHCYGLPHVLRLASKSGKHRTVTVNRRSQPHRNSDKRVPLSRRI